MTHRTPHTFGRTVRLDPPVRFDCCDECGRLEHLRPLDDQIVCDSCRASMLLEQFWDWPDDAA